MKLKLLLGLSVCLAAPAAHALSASDVATALSRVAPEGTYVGKLGYKEGYTCYVITSYDERNEFRIGAHILRWRHNWQIVSDNHLMAVNKVEADDQRLVIGGSFQSPLDKFPRDMEFTVGLRPDGSMSSVDFRPRDLFGNPKDDMPYCVGLKKVSDKALSEIEVAERYGTNSPEL